MGSHRPSRRQLLGGLLAGLFAWVGAARPAAARPPARRRPRAWRFPAARSNSTTISFYDSAGRCTEVREGRPAPAPPPGGAADAQG